ncbi:MAG: TrbI/VirB10 family protein [Sphingomonas sp.]|nr:TrbI/VirB10 family protein [Sphingomonas sp.]
MTQTPPVKSLRVARVRKRASAAPFAFGLLLLGSGVFAKLADSRADREAQLAQLPPLAAASAPAPTPPPADPAAPLPPAPFSQRPPVLLTATAPPGPVNYVVPAPGIARAPVANVAAERAKARLGAPTLIFDLAPVRVAEASARSLQENALSDSGQPATVQSTVQTPAPDPTGAAIAAAGVGSPVGAAPPAAQGLSGNENFATRVGRREVEVARAERLGNLDRLIPQGAIIAAVLETALNTDLPGYARATVSRNVLSFDGSAVLIPAGSRVIGEYNSGVAQGASRVFIVWSRLIRPDGVSIALASPATDDLGRGGVPGKVNRHFLQRFGGAILTSVLTGGIGYLTARAARGSAVVVSSSNEANSLASQASRGTDIPPTITTKQGANVRIFVARDLDFSAVGPVG